MNYNPYTGKLYYKEAAVINVRTGEIVHEFTGADLIRGKQYWRSWCVGNYYKIEEESEEDNLLALEDGSLDIDGKAYYILVA